VSRRVPLWLLTYAASLFRGNPDELRDVLERCSVAGADFRGAAPEVAPAAELIQAAFMCGFLMGRNDREDHS